MKLKSLSLLALALTFGGALSAQEARFGVAINLAIPTGPFSSTSYPPDSQVATTTTDRYDAGVGAQFTVAFPVDRKLAIRLNLGGQSFSGRSTAPGYARLNLQNQVFSVGGELQLFGGDGNAFRQSGTYFLAGLSADFERYDSSYGDPDYYPDNTMNRTRMGGLVGIGHTFRPAGSWRYSLEATYHKTLTAKDLNAGDPPAADFLKFSFGIVF